jgi:ubiquinone/menaquinone biosynthesis C-methylase UbiE
MNTIVDYHKHITDTYDKRSDDHDKSEWHRKTALKLIEELPPRVGSSVLDIGTGTGSIAFHAATIVGPNGKVIGVDLSKGMLAQANAKLAKTGFNNINFILGDMEHLNLPTNSINYMYCASTFFCALNPLATLQHWYSILTTGGGLAFHAIPETSYFWVSVARDVLSEHGIHYLLNTPTATIDKTRNLLSKAGFKKIEIREVENGYYVPWEQAKDSWISIEDFAPGQYPHPVSNVAPEIMALCQNEYLSRIEKLNSDKGVWNDVTMFYIYAFK